MARGGLPGALVLATFLTLGGCREPAEEWEPAPPQSVEAPGLDPGQTHSRSRLDAEGTAVLLLLFVAAPFGLVAGWSLLWWRLHRRRAAAERAFDPKGRLADGPAVILGQVEPEEGASGPAIQRVIWQRGREWKGKHGWQHQWRETSRAVRVRPFRVRLFTGERVRVEPDERVVLRDDLSRVEPASRFERVRFAEVTPGETVHVTGTLSGAARQGMGPAYRAAADEPVLRPSRLAPMVVSTERPGETSERRAGFYRRWLVAVALLALALPVVVFPTVTLLALTGEAVGARPVATRHWQVYHKPKNGRGYYVQHYALRSVREEGGRARVLTDECSAAAWSCVRSGACPEVRYTVSALSDDVAQTGDGPQLTDGRAALLGFVALVLLVAFPIAAFSTRPWYLRRKLVEGGAGQLPQ